MTDKEILTQRIFDILKEGELLLFGEIYRRIGTDTIPYSRLRKHLLWLCSIRCLQWNRSIHHRYWNAYSRVEGW